jgi:hypothetical protein
MTTTIASRGATLAALGTLLLASSAAAQNVASRVSRVREGQVRMSFAVREDYCGHGNGISRGNWRNNSITWDDRRRTRDVEYDITCDYGPGRLVLEKSEGEIIAVRFYVGGRWRPNAEATDLGTVGTRDASDLLQQIAESGDGRASRDAIFPLTMVDSITVWRGLMRLARNEDRPRETRKQAVFWLGQLAEEPATAGLDDLVGEEALDSEVRKQAVFALSQRPKDEGVPALIRIVRTNRDREVRKTALFWLGQSNDPRALDLFEELLSRR